VNAERNEAHIFQIVFPQRKKLVSRLRIQILHHRHRCFTDERETTRAGTALGGVAIRIQPEHANAYD